MMEILTQRERYLVDQAVRSTLAEMGIKKPVEMSQIQAYKRYGESIVKRWVRQGKIQFERRGTGKTSTKYISTDILEKLSTEEKRVAINFKR